jgi:hypothetical protein
MGGASSNLISKNTFSEQYASEVKKNQYITFTAEVIDIVLDDSHKLFKSNHTIGMIEFKSYYGGINGYAMPLNVYDYVTPILHESIQITQGTNFDAGTVNESLRFYYSEPISIWNIVNCNLSPYSTRDINANKPTKSNEYSNFSGIIPDIKTTVKYGKYFKEKLYVPKLKLFEGDIIKQGRWGQSLRFSSVTKPELNSWSDGGDIGNPIVILRVDQKQTQNVNDITVEDINTDAASIYLCDNVKIPIKLSSDILLSYKYKNSSKSAESPLNFIGKQLLISSDRLVFNAKKNSLIFSSKKTMHFSSDESINMDSNKNIILDAPELVFGYNANNPAVLGNELNTILSDMNSELQKLCKLISTINTVGSAVAQTLSPALIPQFTNSGVNFSKITEKLNTILSKKLIIE